MRQVVPIIFKKLLSRKKKTVKKNIFTLKLSKTFESLSTFIPNVLLVSLYGFFYLLNIRLFILLF